MALPYLTRLPSEIIYHICIQFCKHCNHEYTASLDTIAEGDPDDCSRFHRHSQVLVSLTQTCWRLSKIAQPVLYHDIQVSAPLRLLRTLVARPDLAAVVRGVHVPHADWAVPDKDEVAAIEEARARADAAFPEGWVDRWGESGCFMRTRVLGLLLGLMTGLQALSYTVEENWPDAMAPGQDEVLTEEVEVVASPSLGWPNFPSLKHLNLTYFDPEGGYSLGESLETRDLIRNAPNLVSLRLHMCFSISPGLRLDGLKSLILSGCIFPHGAMAAIIGACPLLERLSFEVASGPVTLVGTDGDEFLPSELWRALRPLRATLRHLDLGPIQDSPDKYALLDWLEGIGLTASERLGSFADFNELDTFIVMTDLFRSDDDGGDALDPESFHNSEDLVELLPKGVRVLGLEAPDSCGYEDGVVLAQAIARGQFPNLEQVAVTCPTDEWDTVRAAFAAVGMKCEKFDATWIYNNRKTWQTQWPGYV